MTAPRTALFQRKGDGKDTPIPKGEPNPEGSPAENIDATGEGEPVECPACGCAFDPVTMEVVAEPGGAETGVPDALSAMFGGGEVAPEGGMPPMGV